MAFAVKLSLTDVFFAVELSLIDGVFVAVKLSLIDDLFYQRYIL